MIHVPLPPNFDEVYLKQLDDEIASASGHLLSGRCADFSAYKAATGRINALQDAKKCFTELVSRLQTE